MVTYAPSPLKWLADEWERAIGSAVCSGIVGDQAHQNSTSKHNSRQDNPSGSWAVTHSKDQQGPGNMACAIDMSMSEKDMKLVHGRFKNLYNARSSDPRAPYVDCFNGWDGNGSPGRYDLPAGTVSTTTDDHKWHEHVESFYLYAGTDDESWKAARAILSVVKGETAEQWLSNEEGDMDQGTFDARMDSWVKTRYEAADDAASAVVGSRNRMRGWAWAFTYGMPPGQSVSSIFLETHSTVKAIKGTVDLIATKVDIDPAELAAIQEAAYEGALAGAANVDAIVAGILAGLDSTGLTDEQTADVEAAVRNVFGDAATAEA